MIWAVREAEAFSPRAPSMRKQVPLGKFPSAAVTRTQALHARGCDRHEAQQLASVVLCKVVNLRMHRKGACG